jgi:hypothetical protein
MVAVLASPIVRLARREMCSSAAYFKQFAATSGRKWNPDYLPYSKLTYD